MVSATGPEALALDGLADLIAASADFQSWTGSASAAIAKTRVYFEDIETTGVGALIRPFALVVFEKDEIDTFTLGRGTLDFCLDGEIPAPYLDVPKDAAIWFANHASTIVSEVRAESLNAGRLLVRKIEAIERQGRADQNSETQYMRKWFKVYYGTAG